MCLMNVFQCVHYLKNIFKKKKKQWGCIQRWKNLPFEGFQFQFTEQEVKKLHVEQEHHLQESALHGKLKIISNFINVIF